MQLLLFRNCFRVCVTNFYQGNHLIANNADVTPFYFVNLLLVVEKPSVSIYRKGGGRGGGTCLIRYSCISSQVYTQREDELKTRAGKIKGRKKLADFSLYIMIIYSNIYTTYKVQYYDVYDLY